MWCRHCNAQIRDDSRFCPYCGNLVGPAYSQGPTTQYDYNVNSQPYGRQYHQGPANSGKKDNYKYTLFAIAGLVFLAAIVWGVVALTRSGDPVRIFAGDLESAVKRNDIKSLMLAYPGLAENDSLVSEFDNSPKIEKVDGNGDIFKLDYGNAVVYVKKRGRSVGIEESYGLLAFPEDRVDYALSKKIWNDKANDLEKAAIMNDADFIDSYKKHIAVLTDDRIRDVIKNHKCTKSYNLITKVFKLAREASITYEDVWSEHDYNAKNTYKILSQSDDEATVAVNYHDNYSDANRKYVMTLKKEKYRDSSGEDIYIWLIDDIADHPDWMENRSEKAAYINDVYRTIKEHGGPANYWESMNYDMYDPSLLKPYDIYVKNAQKFIDALNEYFPGGIAK